MHPATERAAHWAGLTLNASMRRQLARYADWLRTEAEEAGGIGPHESDRIEVRHVADSLCLARAWGDPAVVRRLVDVGSGVGLPGIPLAVTHPNAAITLMDRSGRRCRLLRRACRVLGLTNTEVLEADANTVDRQWPWLVARGWTPPERRHAYLRLLEPGGRAVIAASHLSQPEVPGYETIEIPAAVLDSPAWILTMARP
jgi:16S rRNA (guanine527-N7)-methyltransferase